MSRVGKQVITIPEKTEVTFVDDVLTVKGPLGTLTREFKPIVKIVLEDKTIRFEPAKEGKFPYALWGTYASHVKNMVQGVNTPFEKKLEVQGVGYKSDVSGDTLTLHLGYSHPVVMKIPEGLTVTAEKNLITVSGVNKEEVGAFAAKVRAKRKPEPYKGKGVRYSGEVVRMKQGKKTAK